MKKTLLLLIVLSTTCAVFAQECTDENVKSLPGKWKPGQKGAVSGHSAADLAKEKEIMDNVYKQIRKIFSWTPVGGDITYSNIYCDRSLDYRPKPVINICNKYYHEFFYQGYLCHNGKIDLNEYSLSLTTHFNDIPFKFSESFFVSKKDKDGMDIEESPQADKFAYVVAPSEKNGALYYATYNLSDRVEEPGIVNVNLIISKPGKLPYIIMSKKEYYERWKIKYKKLMAADEAQKAEVAKTLKQVSEKEYNEYVEMLEKGHAVYREMIAKIDLILNSKSAEELSAPATFGEERGEYIEKMVFEHDDGTIAERAPYVIKPNFSYYNNRLPKYSPQVITISFRYSYSLEENSKKRYADEICYKALENAQLMDLLADKIKPLIAE
jgi:hypothetical protein